LQFDAQECVSSRESPKPLLTDIGKNSRIKNKKSVNRSLQNKNQALA